MSEDDDSDLLPSGLDPYHDAHRTIRQRKRHAAAVVAEVERQLNLKPVTPEQSKELIQVGRQLRQQDRIVRGIELLRGRDIDTYYERGFDKVYAHLTSTT